MFFVLPLTYLFCIILLYYAIISTVVSNSALYRLLSYYSWSSCLTKVTKLVNCLLFSGYYCIVQWLLPWRWNFYFKEWLMAFYLSFHFLFLLQVLVASSYETHFLNKKKQWVVGSFVTIFLQNACHKFFCFLNYYASGTQLTRCRSQNCWHWNLEWSLFFPVLDHMDEEEWTRPILSSTPKQNTQQGNHAYHGLVFECIKYVFLLHFVNLSFVQEVPWFVYTEQQKLV